MDIDWGLRCFSEGLASVSTDLPKIALIVWFEKQTNDTYI